MRLGQERHPGIDLGQTRVDEHDLHRAGQQQRHRGTRIGGRTDHFEVVRQVDETGQALTHPSVGVDDKDASGAWRYNGGGCHPGSLGSVDGRGIGEVSCAAYVE